MGLPLILAFSRQRLCRNSRNLSKVMLSKAKQLAFSGRYEDKILRRRLRMTLRYGLPREKEPMPVALTASKLKRRPASNGTKHRNPDSFQIRRRYTKPHASTLRLLRCCGKRRNCASFSVARDHYLTRHVNCALVSPCSRKTSMMTRQAEVPSALNSPGSY